MKSLVSCGTTPVPTIDTAGVTHGPIMIRRAGTTSHVTFPASVAGARMRKLLRSLLKVERVTGTVTDTGVRLKRMVERAAVERASRLVIPAGYELPVVQTCQITGMAYTLTGERRTAPPLPAWAGGVDRVLLAAVGEHERLVVRVGNDIDVAAHIALVCRAFDGMRIVVPVKRVRDVRRVVHLLRCGGVVASAFTGDDRDGRFAGRVAVATYQHAGDERAGLSDADLLVVHDVNDALGEDGRRAIEFAHRDHLTAPRVVGFARADFRPSLNQYRWMTRFYGTGEVMLPAPGVVNRGVEYVFLALGRTNVRVDAEPASIVAIKSAAIWNNPIRNRLVAKLACGFRDGNAAAVAGRFGELDGSPAVGKPASVLVVVENDRHADILLRGGLTRWRSVGRGWGSVPPVALRDPARFGKPLSLVSTFDGLRGMNVTGFDVIIRADAGTGAPPLAPDALNTSDAAAPPLLLIDFDDVCNPVLRGFARQRQTAYTLRDWIAADGSGLPPSLERFLARHPHGNRLRREIEGMRCAPGS